MKMKNLKSVIAILMCFSLTLGIGGMAFSAPNNSIKIILDGKEFSLKYDVDPVIENNRVLVPARDIFEALGAKVDWEGKTKTVRAVKDNMNIKLIIDSRDAKVNKKQSTLDVPARIIDDRTLVPLRFVSVALGAKVGWNAETRTVTIISEKKEPDLVTTNVKYMGGPSAVSLIKILKDQPYLGKNVTVDYELMAQVPLMQANMINGESDITVVPTNTGANVYNKTNGSYQLATVYTWGVLYLSSTEDIVEWNDLKGKDIYLIGKTGTPGIVFTALLEKNGLDPYKDVNLIYLTSPQELASYMISGKAKNAVLPEPIQTQVLMKNKDVKVAIDIQKEWAKEFGGELGYPQASIFVKKEFAKAHPEIVEAFLNEYKASIEWINANPAEAGKVGADLGVMPKAIMIEKSIPRCSLEYLEALKAKPAIEEYLKTLLKANPKSIGEKIPDDEFYYGD